MTAAYAPTIFYFPPFFSEILHAETFKTVYFASSIEVNHE